MLRSCQDPGRQVSALDQPWLHDLVTVLSAPTVVLSEASGQIRAEGAQGALHADIRVLSQAVLTVGGIEPAPVSGGVTGARTAVFSSVARQLGEASIVDPTVQVERSRTAGDGSVRERVRVACYADGGLDTELTLTVAADMAALADIRAGRVAAGRVALELRDGELTWGDGDAAVTLRAPDAAISLAEGIAVLRWPVRIAGRGAVEVGWHLTVRDPSAAVIAATATPPAGTTVRAAADDPRLPRLIGQSLADVTALRMAVPSAPRDVFLAAGAPWYFTLFGRDSIWAARLLLPFGWQLAAGTLRALAGFQGRRVDPETAEAPGKIPHELRRDDPAYYGTIDATPLWVCLLHDAWRWGMPESEVRALLPALRAALDCVREYGDSDGDGLLEYIDHSGHGLANQGWKDSGDSIRFADGRIASPPVALCEVQGYAYEAAMHGADLLDAFGEPGASRCRAWAARLGSAFRAAFWVADADGTYPALALDADKRPVDSLTSNIGHLLGTGLLDDAEEAAVAARLAAPDMASGFGLRTMSSLAGGYNPLSYHCGSVWSHDTAIVIRGLFRSGHGTVAATLADGLLTAASAFGWRLPELYSGAPGGAAGPAPYPAACRPQAWSAAAAGALVQAVLGLDVDVPAGAVRIDPPVVRIGGAGARFHVDGLVAGDETFSAGIDDAGVPYLRGLDGGSAPPLRRHGRRGAAEQHVPGNRLSRGDSNSDI